MIDKQVIIDGVDVSGCEHFNNSGNYNCRGCRWCKDNPNCHYKLYKRKEQECEELKDKIKFMEEYIKTVENTRDELEIKNKRLKLDLIEAKAHGDYLNNLALSETLNLVSEQLDQLKAENDELEKWKKEHLKDVEFIERNPVIDILNLMADNILLEQRNEKLFKTLTEIKEIVEQGIKIHDDIIVSKQILQKITECEGNDGTKL